MLSQANVRRVKAGVSVEELAESIARRGLIQSLHVRPVLDADGQENRPLRGAGGRAPVPGHWSCWSSRSALAKTVPVPCILSEAQTGILIDELSLAENIERAPAASARSVPAPSRPMRDKGHDRGRDRRGLFSWTRRSVKQRLRLASVSPVLLEVYAEDGIDARAADGLHGLGRPHPQEQVWEAIRNGWQKEPYHIRRLLTETTVRRLGQAGLVRRHRHL